MNQLCKVCGEPAAGFHFGAFTCEGCKSFFGRTYNNVSAIAGCKNNNDCVINKKNRTACKACRLRKCLIVGMSKSGSRYGRRSNWFKIHCLLQEQQTQQGITTSATTASNTTTTTTANASLEQLQRLQQIQARQTYQDKTNPCIKTAATLAAISPTLALAAQQHAATTPSPPAMPELVPQPQPPPLQQQNASAAATHNFLNAAKFFNGIAADIAHATAAAAAVAAATNTQHERLTLAHETSRHSNTPSDSGASSAGDPNDDCRSTHSAHHHHKRTAAITTNNNNNNNSTNERNCNSTQLSEYYLEASELRRKQLLQIFRSHSEPLQQSPFSPFAMVTHLPPPPPPILAVTTPTTHMLPQLREHFKRASETITACGGGGGVGDASSAYAGACLEFVASVAQSAEGQHEPIDLSLKSMQQQHPNAGNGNDAGSPLRESPANEVPQTPTPTTCRTATTTPTDSRTTNTTPQPSADAFNSSDAAAASAHRQANMLKVLQKPVPLDLTLAMRMS